MKTKVSSNQKITVEVSSKKITRKRINKKTNNTQKQKLIRKKNLYGERFDLLTGESFVPLRRNQKFATSKNRIEYYNIMQNEAYIIISKSIRQNQQKTYWTNVLSYIELNKGKQNNTIINNLIKQYKLTLNK